MKPLDEIVERLTAHVRTDPSGAKSLAHVLVLVPTAQSGRRLRLALANRLGALVPPAVRMAAQLFDGLEGSGGLEVAGRSDEILAFHEALGEESSLELTAQYSDLRTILGARALTFADVADKIGSILTDDLADVEVERWQKLAEIEQRYLAALETKGKTDRIVRMKEKLADPPHFAGIETIVLAYLLDPLPAVRDLLEKIRRRDQVEVEEIGQVQESRSTMESSVPLFNLQPSTFNLQLSQIVPCATAASEAEKIAEIFASVKPDEALPALCVADEEEFPEIQGALQAKGLKVHDPSRTPLATSSLGHLVAQVAALVRTRSYNVFSAFIRGGDVRRWLCSELKLTNEEYVAALLDLDHAQAKLLPSTIDDIQPKTHGKLRAIFECVDVALRKRGIRQILQAVFAEHLLDERDPDAREFAAAAELVNSLIDECLSSTNYQLPTTLSLDLFSLRLREASYSLEPDEGDVILTDGWLELPFLEADELIVTGFNEGRVPESVVGHAFLPDRLRRGLGLPDNESRLQRDRTILRLAASCRAPGAVKVFFRAMDAKGDVLKPSRLLFDGTNDREFLDRVNRFYGVRAGTEEMRPADLPDAWRLKLEIPPERKELSFTSPSSLDLYLHCPFTYCLKKTFGEKEDDRADELDPSEFGNLIHDALELWGAGQLHDSEDAEAIATELAAHVDAILGKRFGTSVPAIVALQGESAKRRLAAFAKIQVAWHKEGWRTVAAERKLQVVYGQTTVKGRCDRIDFNGRRGEWCVIDYKTFDNPERAVARDRKSGEWKSLQLPLYCAMLDANPEFPEAKREKISAVYCVLGKTDETTLFTEPMNGELVPEAEKKVRELVNRIERGIFWPPSPKDEWRWDFKDWIFNTPEESVDPAWLADQLKRLPKEEI